MTGPGPLLLVLAVLAALPWMPVIRAARGWGGGRPDGLADELRGRSRVGPPGGSAVDAAVVLDLVRAALAAGADVVGAIDAIGDALPPGQREVYARAARALRLGATWDSAFDTEDAVGLALAPAWTDGVDPEPLLAHAAASIRRGRQARAREAAARLGVRLVLPLGLCLLPAFVLLGLVPLLISAGVDLWGG